MKGQKEGKERLCNSEVGKLLICSSLHMAVPDALMHGTTHAHSGNHIKNDSPSLLPATAGLKRSDCDPTGHCC